jgi:Zn-dependent peptidase ImmA (M78 family)
MLRKMAERYRRPLLVFYMSSPPPRGSRGEDFRTLDAHVSQENEALLDALVRDLRARQSLVRAALEDEDEAVPLEFVGSMSVDDGIEAVVASLRSTLALNLEDFRRAPGPEAAFRILRRHAERAGVYVLLAGDLGSHHTALDTDTFRGFAIADPIAPFVAINDKDARAAWSFTLLHELAHVWLGQSGISGWPPEQAIERFCNDVASEFLLPETDLRSQGWADGQDLNAIASQIGDFAKARNLSRRLVAYRLFRSGLVPPNSWTQLRNRFHEEWLEERRRTREEARAGEGGPDYYVIRRHRLGDALLDVTARLVSSGALTTSKAAKVLGVRPARLAAILGERQAMNFGS